MTLAGVHGLVSFEVLGRLIRLQALSGLGDFTGATAQAAALDQLGEVHERPGVSVFTHWYLAMRTAATAGTSAAEESYRQAATLLDHSGMPGVAHGLLPMALLCLRVWRHEPAGFPADTDWGPYHAWARPWLLLARNQAVEAKQALPGTAARADSGGSLEPYRPSRRRPRRPHPRRHGTRRTAARERRDRRGGERHAHRRPSQRLPHRA